MKKATGWAVINAVGDIDIRTVSDTRRAAIVNWIVVHTDIMVYRHHTDEEIEKLWWKVHGNHEVVLVNVERLM